MGDKVYQINGVMIIKRQMVYTVKAKDEKQALKRAQDRKFYDDDMEDQLESIELDNESLRCVGEE